MNPNLKLTERFAVVEGFAPAVPSSAAPRRISLKHVHRATVVIHVKNGASGVVGCAVTLKQSKTVAGGSEKALAFDKVVRNLDTGTSDLAAEAAVASNTFTTDPTVSKNLLYVIDVKPESLDINNGFDCLAVGLGDATAATVTVLYILHTKQGGPQPSVITD